MRAASILVLALAGVRAAGATEYTYVPEGGVHEVSVLPAPLPEVHFGALAAALVGGGRAPPAPALVALGSLATPLAGPALGDTTRRRIAAVVLRRSFQVGDELARLAVLRLRVRFQDSLVATLNGVEIARRNLDPGAPPAALARRTRGSDWEAIFVPVEPGLLRSGENVLTVEVRPSAVRLAPLVDVELTGSDSAHVVRGPILQRVGADRATIVFESDLPTTGEVRLGERVLADPAGLSRRHVIDVDGLAPDREIRYQIACGVGGDSEVSPIYRFHTAPGPGEPVHFVVYGDVRSDHDAHEEVVRAVLAEAPDFVIATGDLVNRATDEAEWQRFFSVEGSLLARTPLFPVLGNHDVGATAGGRRRFQDVFALPALPAASPPGAAWYSFDFGGVHVVILDSNRYEDERQLAWLEEDLASTRARAVVAATHQGPFSHGPHGGDAIAAARYVPVLARHGVAVIFSGHDHLYERGRVAGLTYVVTGGGGAPLYQPRCGVPGRRRCPSGDGVRAIVVAHHYVDVDVYRDDLRMCARRPDGTLLEDCVRLPLPERRR